MSGAVMVSVEGFPAIKEAILEATGGVSFQGGFVMLARS